MLRQRKSTESELLQHLVWMREAKSLVNSAKDRLGRVSVNLVPEQCFHSLASVHSQLSRDIADAEQLVQQAKGV